MCKKFLKNRQKANRTKKGRHFNFRHQTWRGLLILLVVVLGVYYLSLINDKATVGYKISKLEKKAASLGEVNRNLELEIIKLQQVAKIEERAKKLKMVKVDEVDYLDGRANGLAMR